jgi:hypothetical protein
MKLFNTTYKHITQLREIYIVALHFLSYTPYRKMVFEFLMAVNFIFFCDSLNDVSNSNVLHGWWDD